MAADQWCIGFHPQPPHVPDGQLIATNLGPDIRMCEACWSRWIRADR